MHGCKKSDLVVAGWLVWKVCYSLYCKRLVLLVVRAAQVVDELL